MLDEKIANKLSGKIQEGYSYMMDDESATACIEWEKAWEDVITLMKSGNYKSLEALDDEFLKFIGLSNGFSDQYILNLTSDFERF